LAGLAGFFPSHPNIFIFYFLKIKIKVKTTLPTLSIASKSLILKGTGKKKCANFVAI
jgi:hypothetical protein